MIYSDANVILRYLLDDIPEQSVKAAKILQGEVYIPHEVMAEIVYVLSGVYEIERTIIADTLIQLINHDTIHTGSKDVLKFALKIFAAEKIDFVDALLAGYHVYEKVEIATFDKKLNRLIEESAHDN